jgi:hypothetical protein
MAVAAESGICGRLKPYGQPASPSAKRRIMSEIAQAMMTRSGSGKPVLRDGSIAKNRHVIGTWASIDLPDRPIADLV